MISGGTIDADLGAYYGDRKLGFIQCVPENGVNNGD